MQDSFVFTPARRFGQLFHIFAVALLSAGVVWGLWQASQALIGPVFLLYLLPVLLAVAAFPILAYRAYALQSGTYVLERDGIRLRWGLRYEDIPMNTVLWVHPASDMSAPLPLPWLRWPGALFGIRRLPGADSAGATTEVEFMASGARVLVLIATTERIFAISPADQGAFLNTYQRFTEMGSLSPLTGRSVHPTFLLGQVWAAKPARILLLLGLSLCLILIIWVSLAIPTRSEVHMGFYPDGSPGDLVPAVRLFLLPVISIFFFMIDLFLGLFFFRRPAGRPLSYLVWGSGALTPILTLFALFFILRSG